jgi:hypothetical protein
MRQRLAALTAILLTALSLVPAGAHLAALPNKIGLPAEAYMTAQAIYRGWALFGLLWLANLLADLALLVSLRRQVVSFRLALAGTALLLAAFAVFFAWTLPANQATANWTTLPPGWEELRWQWEWSHVTGAVLLLASLVCVTLAGLDADPATARQDAC